MIQIIYGKFGTGKTKKMIERANRQMKESSGDIVFVDDDGRCMLSLEHEIRYINAGEYDVMSSEKIYGFLCGVLAQNFDIQSIYLDGFPSLAGVDSANDMKDCFAGICKVSEKFDINIIMSISGPEDDIPEFLKDYIID